jgi:hypothetical protein
MLCAECRYDEWAGNFESHMSSFFSSECRYDEWAGNYESHMSSVGYPGPRNVALAVAEVFDRRDINILDMAAGELLEAKSCIILESRFISKENLRNRSNGFETCVRTYR